MMQPHSRKLLNFAHPGRAYSRALSNSSILRQSFIRAPKLCTLNWGLRLFVTRSFISASFAVIVSISTIAFAQNSPTSAQPSISPEVASAEAAIAASDWKSAESKLNAYLATHSTDARALFD